MTTETNPIVRYLDYPTHGRAIKAKCAECMGCTKDVLVAGFRSAIRDCTSHACPLHRFRPFQRAEEESA